MTVKRTQARRTQEMLARLDRLPVWPYPYLILWLAGAGFFFSFFDTVTVGLALPVFAKQFHISTDTALWTISSSLLGYVLGSFIDSRISDMFGRRISLYLSVGFFSVGSLLSATSGNIGALIFWRFIIGMGIGAEIANVVTYISELAPAKKRGAFTSIPICIAFVGFSVVPFVGMSLIPNYSWGWRALFALGGAGGLLVFWMRRFTPETIRWLLEKKRFDDAEKELERAEVLAKKRYKKALPEPDMKVLVHLKDETTFSLFMSPQLIKSLVLFACIWFFYYIGNFAWLTLDTKLFIGAGFKLSKSMLLVSISSLGFIAGGLFSVWWGDRVERKYTCMFLALVWAILLLIIGWHTTVDIVMILGFFAAFTISFIIPTLYIYTSEQFPTPIRATCLSITDGLGHLGGAFCGQYTFFFYYLFKGQGYEIQAAFTSLAVTGVIVFLLLLLGRRMTNKSLL